MSVLSLHFFSSNLGCKHKQVNSFTEVSTIICQSDSCEQNLFELWIRVWNVPRAATSIDVTIIVCRRVSSGPVQSLH